MSETSSVPHPPSIRKKSFNCPHCGAFSGQEWYDALGGRLSCCPTPFPVPFLDICLDGEDYLRETPVSFFQNLYLCQCYSCRKISIWVHDKIIYPDIKYGIAPNPDLPEEIQNDFNEAREILHKSPRGAAALLRLVLQNLCIYLKKNKNINKAIKELVADGLDTRIQKALDIVRVIGNNAVHPGTIDIKDDIETASTLFRLINIIAEKMISEPKHIDEIYNTIPEDERKAIEKRDGKSTD